MASKECIQAPQPLLFPNPLLGSLHLLNFFFTLFLTTEPGPRLELKHRVHCGQGLEGALRDLGFNQIRVYDLGIQNKFSHDS